MSSKTLKEFAQEIKLDKKKLEDKLRYQKKVYGREFCTISAGIKYLSEEEQIAICQLLNIPIINKSFGDEFGTIPPPKSEENIAILQERNQELKNQLSDIKSDKIYLQKQLSSEVTASSELRILLQQALKQTEKLQSELTELRTENSKLNAPKKTEIEAVNRYSVTTEKRNSDIAKEKNYNFVDPPKKPFSFDELHPDFNGFLSEFLKYGQQTGNWKISYRRARRLARAKREEQKNNL